jgi:hypothetical protein
MGTGILSVSFYGPFVFDFVKDGVVIYAPQCDGHFASVQTDYEEIGLALQAPQQPFRYQLDQKNITAQKARVTSLYNFDQILVVDSARRRAKAPDPSECEFILRIPRPDQVIGLVADPVSVIQYDLQNPGSGIPEHKATSMRFNYWLADDTEVWELLDVTKSKTIVLALSAKPIPPSTNVQLTFRYAMGAPDVEHKDAEQCFREMRNLFPPLGAWKVRFESPLENHLNDCHAPQIVFATLDELALWTKKK